MNSYNMTMQTSPTLDSHASAIDPVRHKLIAKGSPFELIQIEIDGRSVTAFRNAPESTGAIVRMAAEHDDRVCLVGLDHALSYGQIMAQAGLLQAALGQRGVGAGKRIAIAMHNRARMDNCLYRIRCDRCHSRADQLPCLDHRRAHRR